MNESYFIRLRSGMTFLAGAFPVIFLVSSLVLNRTEMQDSISAYYFTLDPERNLFVGILIAVAVYLVLYNGYSKLDDWVLNIAGLLVAGVALVPMGSIQWLIVGKEISIHGTCAVAFFLCLFCEVIFLSGTTLSRLPPERQSTFRKIYRLIAGSMIVSVGIALIANLLFDGKIVFWVEALGVWCFAAFWYCKTRELDSSIPWHPFYGR